jgi:hypothetical protein
MSRSETQAVRAVPPYHRTTVPLLHAAVPNDDFTTASTAAHCCPASTQPNNFCYQALPTWDLSFTSSCCNKGPYVCIQCHHYCTIQPLRAQFEPLWQGVVCLVVLDTLALRAASYLWLSRMKLGTSQETAKAARGRL